MLSGVRVFGRYLSTQEKVQLISHETGFLKSALATVQIVITP
jgi:hypothetical protein